MVLWQRKHHGNGFGAIATAVALWQRLWRYGNGHGAIARTRMHIGARLECYVLESEMPKASRDRQNALLPALRSGKDCAVQVGTMRDYNSTAAFKKVSERIPKVG